MAALLGAHAGRGDEQFEADLARAVGDGARAVHGQALLVALKASEIIQRRLNSIVQNSTDVVTIVGADHRVRWQAESIRRVLGHDPDAIVGTRVHDLVHPDDRPALDGYFADADGNPEHRRSLTLRLAHGAGGHRHFDVVAANRLHDPSVERLRAQHARRDRPPRARGRAARARRPARARRDARPADRASPTAASCSPPRRDDDRRARRQDQARAAADRPRPLQGAQRHARPPGRRPAPARDRPAARGRACPAPTSWPASAATSSPS